MGPQKQLRGCPACPAAPSPQTQSPRPAHPSFSVAGDPLVVGPGPHSQTPACLCPVSGRPVPPGLPAWKVWSHRWPVWFPGCGNREGLLPSWDGSPSLRLFVLLAFMLAEFPAQPLKEHQAGVQDSDVLRAPALRGLWGPSAPPAGKGGAAEVRLQAPSCFLHSVFGILVSIHLSFGPWYHSLTSLLFAGHLRTVRHAPYWALGPQHPRGAHRAARGRTGSGCDAGASP